MVVLTSFPPPSEGIRHQQPNTSAHVETKDLGSGTLYIAESRVSWVSEEGQGFSLEYPAISLHAVSRDPSAFPKECLYLMVDAKLDDNSEKEIEDNEDDEDEGDTDDTPVTEIRFVPQDNSILDTMYHTMSECQTLHPDPDDSTSENDEEDDEDDHFEDAEDDDSLITPSSAQIGAGDSIMPDQLPVPNVFGGAQATNTNQSDDEPMDVSQFEDAEPEH